MLPLIGFFFSCQRADTQQTADTNKETVQITSEKAVKANSNKNSDTLTIDERSVVFFSISQEEYDKIIKEEGEGSGINEVIDDFNYYASEVTDSLRKVGFKTVMTNSKTFAFINNKDERNFITRDSKEGRVGLLLFDGIKEPMLDYGVGTDIDYLSIVDEYFKKK